ncbi:hypothetical protein JYT90_00665 [bacterium AH-315-P07]|nr:hypothetical protein [bacterium AH-315-P07]
MKACQPYSIALLLGLLAALPAQAQGKQGTAGIDHDTLSVSGLTAVVGNNNGVGEHRAWYNGVFSMTSPDQAVSPFVPFYAGVNLEHYFDAGNRHPERDVFFEPRAVPMTFRKIDDTTAELRQETTPYWGVESRTTIRLREPYYLDYEFRCVPHKPGLAGGLLGVFWASYMNGPLDKSIYFLRDDSTLDAPVWEQFYSQSHNRDSVLRHKLDTFKMPKVENPEALWLSESPLRYSEPFFYGRYKNMVLIYIFKSESLVRFTTSPSGGGRTPDNTAKNPAWDFQLLVPDYKVGETYGLDLRIVYKAWAGREDVLDEVRKYLYSKGD